MNKGLFLILLLNFADMITALMYSIPSNTEQAFLFHKAGLHIFMILKLIVFPFILYILLSKAAEITQDKKAIRICYAIPILGFAFGTFSNLIAGWLYL